MNHFKLVPGSPSFYPPAGKAHLDEHQLFTYARHAMIQFLAFLRQREGFEKINLLSPLYMCHEVITTLGQHAEHIAFYSQQEDFGFDLAQIKEQCLREDINVLLVSHLYGKRIAIETLRAICDELCIVLLEDSAHLPWFVLEDGPQYSHARFFSYRKLFAMPYGASVTVCPEWREEFSSFCRTTVEWKAEAFAGWRFQKWLVRETVKTLIKRSGMTWRRAYTELGIDPLNENNFVPGFLQFCLRHLPNDHYVENRKRNHELLRQGFAANFPSWKILYCGRAQDVPYQFLIYRNTWVDATSILDRFLYFGVSAVKGLELPPATRDQLGNNHPFNNQICLPLHQDVTLEQIDHVLTICRMVLL